MPSTTATRIVLGLVLAAALLNVAAHAAVMGVDYGSEYIKLAAPKNNNIDIVLNEQSNRKSANYIGFRGEERYFGDDAKNLAPRFPDNMFTFMNRLVGVPFNDTVTRAWFADKMYQRAKLEESVPPADAPAADANVTAENEPIDAGAPAVEDVAEKVDSTVSFRTGSNPNISYTAETLMGMMFTYVKDTVRKDTKLRLRDAVVTIPAFYTRRQRQAVIDSGALAGVNVIATVHATTAAALQWGLQSRGFGNETRTLLVYDMGATKTDVGVYSFEPPVVTKGKKIKNAEAYGTMKTKAIVSDPNVGGRAFDACLAELIENKFIEANPKLPRVLPGDTLAKRKSIISLMRAANKAKETLSVNKQVPVIAEGMAPNKDFATTITKDEFEEHCKPLFDRAVELAKSAVEHARVTVGTIDGFEMMGGASRIPKIGSDLTDYRGRLVDRTLNSDEAAAVGAAFYGGVLTGRFRIKSFRVQEPLFVVPGGGPTNISFSIGKKPDAAEDAPAPVIRPLFTQHVNLNGYKVLSFNRTEDFNVSIYVSTTGPNGEPQHDLDYIFQVKGINSALRAVPFYKSEFGGLEGLEKYDLGSLSNSTELNHPNNTHKVHIQMRVTESGLVDIDEAEVRIDYAKNVTKRNKVNLTEEELAEEVNKTRTRVIEQEAEAEVLAEKRKKYFEELKRNQSKANATENATEGDTAEAAAEEPAAEETPVKELTPEEQAIEDERKANETKRKERSLNKKITAALKKMRTYKMVPTTVEEMQRTVKEIKVRRTFTFPKPLTRKDKKFYRAILNAFDEADELRRMLAKSKNDLEAYLLWTKMEGVLDNAEMKEFGVLTAEAEANVTAVVTKVSDWLDEEAGDSTPMEEYDAKLVEVKEVVRPLVKALKKAKKPKKAPVAEKNETETASEAGAGSDEESAKADEEETASSSSSSADGDKDEEQTSAGSDDGASEASEDAGDDKPEGDASGASEETEL